ncbi:Potassium uptake protein, TrkA [Nitrosococcus oceani ATCC 19707]|uniref:Trk system potassium uptake protein TrkA n=2 Tax=Nitrosococcus oceani TaxID=1229 RepID=Q3J6T4_NITOC|nr:Trk system potassium transporter TrkA [Nitrosococcus oceani]ABA59462.1 Potassium uptake protein, TrkA [Nitrosococcus oceani ATCC 19707]EDZ65377.1 TrkA-N domain family [Nitrosococcus oceani AFC27]KFI18204.1 potassium transporter peripheral membrane component [Nitrosococcus oceani C-27]GEM19968.1 Trk system potassium transport protein TrkA [Nitrosococcus oceani]
MKIIILGAGQVGASVAVNLASEANDITLVDTNGKLLQSLQDRLDIRTVQGWASHPDVLAQAGAEDTDMIVAVTSSDETNMIACQIAYSLFHTPTKVARVRAAGYLAYPELFSTKTLPIDVLISPEQLVTDYIKRLIDNPGTFQVLDFADGRVQLVAVRAYYGGLLVGHQLRELSEHIPGVETRVAAIFRQDKSISPQGSTVIEADDEVFFIAAQKDIPKVMGELRRLDNPYKRIMLGGGGSIGQRLAQALEEHYQVKIIETDPKRARVLSEELHKSIVLQGDAASEELLLEENIEDTDIYCALTNDDEINILSAMLAKRLGAGKVMSLINRAAYVDLVESGAVDIAVSPQQATISSLLAHIRHGDVVAAHSLRRGAAEALEAVAHGDPSSSKVIGRAIEEIKLPPGTTIGAIARNEEVLMAHHDTIIESGDHVILFLVDKHHVPDVERLFQVGFTFL